MRAAMMQDSANALSDVLLERLEDIHRAAEPSWWPPAPGWWVLGAIVLAALAWLGVLGARRIRVRLRRRRLLRELESLARVHDPRAEPAAYLGALNRVFRSIALRAFPGTHCARLEGAEWVRFIRERLPGGGSDSLDALESGPYRRDPEFDAADLHAQARQWVAHYG